MNLPRCVCCRQTLCTELYLDLQPFGISGCACESCVRKFTNYTQDLEEL